VRILALSPHTDDVELACGATIIRLIEEGHHVSVIAFSTGNEITGATRGEFNYAMSLLGVERSFIWRYLCREFDTVRQAILDDLITKRAELEPDLVFAPSGWHLHQDHRVVAIEALRAFPMTSILGYRSESKHISAPSPTLFVKVAQRHVQKKLDVLACYESQQSRPYFDKDALLARLRFRGTQCGAEYAEALDVIRWVQ
jgi:LmbE family N-acetylglucosaminyl deacetylase